MRDLQQAGKIRAVGIYRLPLKILADVATQAKSISSFRYPDQITIQMDTHLTPVLQKLGIGLLNAAPVHLRLLTKEGALETSGAGVVGQDWGGDCRCLFKA